MHPLDRKGRTPLNLERGVFSNVGTKGVNAEVLRVERGQDWKTLKSPPREALSSSLVATGPPARVSRTVVESNSGVHAISLGKDSSIAYDPHEHRFVNASSPEASSSAAPSAAKSGEIRVENGRSTSAASTPTSVTPPRVPAPPVTRSASSPPARTIVPPPAPRYSGGERGSSSSRSSGWGGSASSSGTSSGRSSSPSASSTPASHHSSGRPH
jgi:hypothetical protein